MIIGAGKQLEIVRNILSNDINDVFVCQNVGNKNDENYYTLIRLHDDEMIKSVLEIIYDDKKNYNLPQNLFCDVFVEVDTLNILMKYIEPRKIFMFLKSYMDNDYSQHMIIKNFLYKCLSLDVSFPILDLMLDKDNINLDSDLNVYFNSFLDFSKFDKNATEEKCVKKCSDLIYDILLSNEELTEKSNVKAIELFVKKRRHDSYNKMIDLYNDFKIKENKYKKGKNNIIEEIKDRLNNISRYKLKRAIVSLGSVIIVFAVVILICNILKLDLPFSKYQGMNVIGTVHMGEK